MVSTALWACQPVRLGYINYFKGHLPGGVKWTNKSTCPLVGSKHLQNLKTVRANASLPRISISCSPQGGAMRPKPLETDKALMAMTLRAP